MSYQLELRHLRYFLAVAEELHFKKAADKLFISQPGLSKQIKVLEDLLDIQLFERHNRKVELTDTGKYLQSELSQWLLTLDNIMTHAESISKGYDGNLRFGYVGSAMHEVIPELLSDIRKTLPKIIFDLKEMDNQVQIDSIINHEIDLGFVRLDRLPRGISSYPVHEDTFSLVLPKKHRITQRNFKKLSQVKDESFILFDSSYSDSYYNKVMKIFDDSGFSPIISHKTVHAHTIYSLVENNFGISIVPTSLQQGYKKDIKFIELKKIKSRTTLQLIWHKENPNPVLKKVVGMMKGKKK